MPNPYFSYQPEKMRKHLGQLGQYLDKKQCASYPEFKYTVPVLSEAGLSQKIDELINGNCLQSCSFSMTSGSTGNPKLLINALWRNGNQIHYAAHFKKMIESYVLSKVDVVANLFTAGGFSTLYDGCNRLLEGIGCHLLPIGRLDSFSLSAQYQMLDKMLKVGLNVLFGTPSSIVYLLKLSLTHKINLPIKKIIFTGEPFSSKKRDFVRSAWSDVEIYGLYGHSETGFIGLNTPRCANNHYHYFDDWFFLETIKNDSLLVTSYADTLMPIVRYEVGDAATLIDQLCACDIDLPLLALRGRCDKKFNFAGNLISSELIKNTLSQFFHHEFEFQIQLKAANDGRDQLNLFLNIEDSNQGEKNILEVELLKIDEINEAIEKQAGVVTIDFSGEFSQTERQKQPLIIDYRIESSK